MTIVKRINWKTIITGVALTAILVLSACSDESNNTPTDNTTLSEDTTTDANEGTDDPTTDDASGEEADTEDTDDSSKGGAGDISKGEGTSELEIGDTGEVQSTLGTFNVTVTEVTFPETLDDMEPEFSDGLYVVVSATVDNTSGQPINAEDIAFTWLNNLDSETSTENYGTFEEVQNFEGEIAPSETMEGEFAFEAGYTSNYQFQIGNESYSNVLLWNVEAPEQAQ
ncbi:DUF4352 domain-containing protein [Aureibacillus halotolerans]|uniref:Uncharacterized protein DUF4352 n=1 Tax=Aureibacillus halotolerans TaxID=1508390 RepID=A0A4R6UBS6_9BACI|nr:DUF4352 domain-containing protein [Aureibacillus halotolerans]TDQ42205.1 uncharacterized protein DUF4352 [Aureibacillus halotolerans]